MSKKRTESAWLKPASAVIAVTVMAALLLLVVRTVPEQRLPNNQPASRVPEATPQVTSIAYNVEALSATAEAIEATLPTPTLIPGWPQDKARDMSARDLSDTAYATARVLYPPPPGYWPDVTPVPTRIWPTPIPIDTPTGDGVIRNEESNGPPCTMLYGTNEWSGQINGQQGDYYTLACAGSDKQDKTLGALVIQVGSHDPDQPVVINYYVTAAHTGQLRIIGEANHTLTFRASDNSLLYFDLIAQRWVDP